MSRVCWTFVCWIFSQKIEFYTQNGIFRVFLKTNTFFCFFFYAWLLKIEPCLTATRPPDCPEKRAGAANCNADRSGIFKVQDMPLVLHVGDNVHECLSCMIQVSHESQTSSGVFVLFEILSSRELVQSTDGFI